MLDEKSFLRELTDLMNTNTHLEMDTILTDLEDWDSMSHVAFIARMSTVCHARIDPADARAASTVHDLYQLVK